MVGIWEGSPPVSSPDWLWSSPAGLWDSLAFQTALLRTAGSSDSLSALPDLRAPDPEGFKELVQHLKGSTVKPALSPKLGSQGHQLNWWFQFLDPYLPL